MIAVETTLARPCLLARFEEKLKCVALAQRMNTAGISLGCSRKHGTKDTFVFLIANEFNDDRTGIDCEHDFQAVLEEWIATTTEEVVT